MPDPAHYTDPSNVHDSIVTILEATVEEEPLKAYFCELSSVLSAGNLYATDADRDGRCVDIHDPVFPQHWT